MAHTAVPAPVPPERSLDPLRAAVHGCRACPLARATSMGELIADLTGVARALADRR